MVVLITGASGFVGRYVFEELSRHGHQAVRTDIAGDVDTTADLLNEEETRALISGVKPDAVIHLAGQASVALSWEKPKQTETLNVHTTLNLLQAIAHVNKAIRLLVIGSSDQYGKTLQDHCSITEDMPCRPMNPYAVSKLAQEQMALAVARHHQLDVLCTRSFNHIGPGQKPGFVVPDFSQGIVAIERGAEPVLKVGNLSVYRDFSDVRDIARAYRLLIESGRSGEVYNIGSGRLVKIDELLQTLIGMSGASVRIEVDSQRLRTHDIKHAACDYQKLSTDTGWEPQIPLQESLKDTLEWWRAIG